MGLFSNKNKIIDDLNAKLAAATSSLAEQDKYIEKAINEIEILKDEIEKKNSELNQLKQDDVRAKTEKLKEDYSEALETYKKLKREVAIYEDTLDVAEFGVYKPIFNFDDSEKYKARMLESYKAAKDCVKNGYATAGGELKIRKRLEKVILLGFNGVCDQCIADVKWNNIFQLIERVNKAFDAVNKAFEDFGFYITTKYRDLRIDSIQITYEYMLKKHREKEEQDALKAVMREEEKARREIEAALIKANADEVKYLERIEKATRAAELLTGDKLAKALFQIEELKAKLEEAQANKNRALSMAEQTKRGYVYIISNIGSFGEDVYKIGLTRRLDPMERVRELGDASVPFPFDVHAMIFSEDAPKLEAALHREFRDKSVNMCNNRKEFFKVSLDEIARVVKSYNANIEFTRIAEARDYRESVAMRTNIDQYIENTNTEFPSKLLA